MVTVTKKDVDAFSNSCVLVRSAYEHQRVLFDQGEDRRSLLKAIAPILFGDIYALLRDSIFLGICRLTDPETTGRSDNLTVKFLIKNSDFSKAPQEQALAQALSDRIHHFRDKIAPARNKRIGHLDRAAATGGGPLGAASKQDWEAFWNDLEQFLSIIKKFYLIDHFQWNTITDLSDGNLLIKALKESRFFHEILNDHELTDRCADIALSSKYANY